ncbi:hypothetical protein M2165_002376 [Variovorax sp. TBS-050B]|uniref:tripartite tricarboxylate transporter TctB family protein n=1 Tax=Variovorax sp. TBS-050B TaxID=2940551 RepID=UPI002476F37F|nr:tripartite tricarboxylate transporter TctB family protein [Variovorax sp. TBS-050B]MDH6592487.1 hypothetical protein [Variovorax sp. TBS-050B]
MRPRLLSNRDALAGLLFVTIGAFAFFAARGYPVGTIAEMGPGYFPRTLGCLLMLLGAGVLARGLRSAQPVEGRWAWGALALLTVSMLAFGAGIERIGLVPALALLLPIAALAGREFRPLEMLLLTAVLCLGAVAIFVWGLKLPYALFAWRF